MPSKRISEPTVSLNMFEVVGLDGAESNFVRHAGLSAESTNSRIAKRIPVIDMGPPLHGQAAPQEIRADVIGSANLTDDEARKIQTFVDRHANEHLALSTLGLWQVLRRAPEMYCVHPHTSPHYELDGRYTRTRFSCSGFVFEAYRKARIPLVDLNHVPTIDMTIIAIAYPVETKLIRSGRLSAEELGLAGNGPWPVLLCGYLFHALNRSPDAIRDVHYAPRLEDRYFE